MYRDVGNTFRESSYVMFRVPENKLTKALIKTTRTFTELKMNTVTMQKGSGDKRTNLRNCGKGCIGWIL